MGYYTKFKFKATLKNVPDETINYLHQILNLNKYVDIEHCKCLLGYDEEDSYKPSTHHDFFKCYRCDVLLNGKLKFQNGFHVIEINSELKNYNHEIEKFISFIEPFIIQRKRKKYLGKCKGESAPEECFYIQNGKIESRFNG